MANLFDTINQNRQQLAGQQAPVTDETGRIQKLLRAKSGKNVGTSDTAVSSLGEQAAVADTNAQLASLTPGLQLQQQAETIEREGQQQKVQQAEQDIEQSRRFNNVQNNIRTQQLLGDLSRDRGSLDLDKDRSKLEQVSFLMSMQDRKYTDELEAIGKRRRLDDEVAFRNEMEQVAFRDSIDILRDKLGKGDVLAANDREFATAMSNLSLDEAMKIANLEMQYAQSGSDLENREAVDSNKRAAKAANQQALYQGVSGLVSGGIQASGVEKRKEKLKPVNTEPDLSSGSVGDLRASEGY